MRTNSKILSNQGFTLIELMAVVAIIGILAAIAIPNYIKYQRTSKQAEAKINLSSGYLAEMTLMNSEFGGSFSAAITRLQAMDASQAVAATSQLNYAFGFRPTVALAVPAAVNTAGACGPAATRHCLHVGWLKNGNARDMAVSIEEQFYPSPLSGIGTFALASAAIPAFDHAATRAAFNMVAIGALGAINVGAATNRFDAWSIDQNKTVNQGQDGTQDGP